MEAGMAVGPPLTFATPPSDELGDGDSSLNCPGSPIKLGFVMTPLLVLFVVGVLGLVLGEAGFAAHAELLPPGSRAGGGICVLPLLGVFAVELLSCCCCCDCCRETLVGDNC